MNNYKILIEFDNLSNALKFNKNSSTKYKYLYKVFDKFYVFNEEHDIKNYSKLLKRD